MKLKPHIIIWFAAIAFIAAALPAQTPPPVPAEGNAEKKEDKKWDVDNPPGPRTEASIDVTEGTWLYVDVSPDGKEIAFDLLGDIYTIPIGGGEAKDRKSVV